MYRLEAFLNSYSCLLLHTKAWRMACVILQTIFCGRRIVELDEYYNLPVV